MNSNLPVQFGRGTFSTLGCQLPKDLTLVEWKSMWPRLRGVSGARKLVNGDRLNYGRKFYPAGHDGRYDFLIKISEEEYGTLRDWAWVAGAVKMSQRRHNLSWSHYRTVAHLPERKIETFLSAAVENEWGVSELRRHIRTEEAVCYEPVVGCGFVLSSWIELGIRNLPSKQQ